MEGRTRVISRTGGGAALRALLALVLAIGLMPAIPATALADDTESAPPTTEPDVVQVGDLPALEAAVTNGGKVVLTADIEGVDSNLFINSGNELDIDLAGHTINMNGFSLVSNGGEIVIRDNTAGFVDIREDWSVRYSAGKITTSENAGTSPVTVQNGGTVDIRSGIVECVSTVGASAISCIGNQDPATWETPKPSSVSLNGGYVRGYAYGIYVSGNGASVLVNDGAVEAAYAAISGNGTVSNVKNEGGTSITVNGGYVIACDPNGPNDMKGCIYHPQDGSLVVNDGVLHAVNGFGILLRAGDLRITGGSVDATGSVSGTFADGSTTVSSNAVYLDYAADYPGAKSTPNEFEMTGGTVSCDKSLAPVVKTDASAEGIKTSEAITGGTLKGGDIAEGLVVPGMKIDADGRVVVDEKTAVATVGSVGYTTLSAAIAAASNSGTVVLKSNVNESVSIEEGATVTIDLNGCKITNTEGNHTITNNGTLTVKDSAGGGVVDNTVHQKAALLNEGEVTVYGGKFTRSEEKGTTAGSGGNSYYVVVNRGGMTFEGGEVTSTGCYSSLVQNLGEMTVNKGSFSNGGIALKNDEGSGFDAVLEINGGTVTADQAVQNWGTAVIKGGELNGKVATWNYEDGTGWGMTTIEDNAVVNGDVLSGNYADSHKIPFVTISGGTINGSLVKVTHTGADDATVVVEEPNFGLSIIKVAGGAIEATDGNKKAIPYFIADGNVAKVDSNMLQIVGRGNLGAGEYIVADGADITPDDLADGLEVVENEDGTFTVVEPDRPVTPPTKPSYDVTVDQPENGAVELSAKTAKEGQKVIVTVKPDEGFELASLVVADEDGNALKLELSADGTYSFEMPAGDVTVHAAFECDGGELCPSHGFTDVDQSQWYHAAIDWAVEAKVLNGIDGTTLMMPDAEITRAQMAQVLWNVEGNEPAASEAAFSDVDPGEWYVGAISWAVESGVFEGYAGTSLFGPDEPLTREQAALVLQRWSELNGEDVSGRADLSGYPDAELVSDWALDGVSWAVSAGILKGVDQEDGTALLDPAGTATRAQVAALMMRLEGQRTA